MSSRARRRKLRRLRLDVGTYKIAEAIVNIAYGSELSAAYSEQLEVFSRNLAKSNSGDAEDCIWKSDIMSELYKYFENENDMRGWKSERNFPVKLNSIPHRQLLLGLIDAFAESVDNSKSWKLLSRRHLNCWIKQHAR